MHPIKQLRPPPFWTLCLLLALGLFAYASSASASTQTESQSPLYQTGGPNDDYCLACHQEDGKVLQLEDEALSVTINPIQYGLSAHAEENLTCVDCHTTITTYPHPEVDVDSVREYSISFKDSCKDCHEDQYEVAPDNVHEAAFTEGKENAPLCADCHNPHTQPRIIGKESGELTIAARIHVPQTCQECHSENYEIYKNSVHGKALTEEGNLDVPTCTNCHGVHNIKDPTTNTFRNASPHLCADCHDDPEIMDKYGLSTEVLETYEADFHGTNVKLFSMLSPDGSTNKAVCFDCHGVHDITKVDNPATGVAVPENLLTKCQRCHPDATQNFTGAWLGHTYATAEEHPITYYVNLFYNIAIPGIIGGMIFFVLTDIYRRYKNRTQKGGKHS